MGSQKELPLLQATFVPVLARFSQFYSEQSSYTRATLIGYSIKHKNIFNFSTQMEMKVNKQQVSYLLFTKPGSF